MAHAFRGYASLAGVLSACVALSACTGGPTYGTDKTATEQLFSDLGNAVSVAPDKSGPRPKYTPRPGLVTPPKGATPTLVAPQASLADRANNPGWTESPEETRKRLVEEADANANNSAYRSPLLEGRGQAGTMTEEERWNAYRQAKSEASPAAGLQRRRYLSDPPSVYRQPTDAAALTDLGEPEEKKKKRRLKEAQKEGRGSSSWWNPFQ